MTDRFPGYDVMAKRRSPSWNEQTRRVIEARLALPRDPRFFTEIEYATVMAIADRIVPQPRDRPPIPVAALIDNKLFHGHGDGYRFPGMPPEHEAWRRGLRALDEEACAAHGKEFRRLASAQQEALLRQMQAGTLTHPAWEGMPCKTFFTHRLGHDIVFAYYAHPTAWNEIGFGGPASPRGYVRLGFDERDPWEAAEVKNGDVESARRSNGHVG